MVKKKKNLKVCLFMKAAKRFYGDSARVLKEFGGTEIFLVGYKITIFKI